MTAGPRHPLAVVIPARDEAPAIAATLAELRAVAPEAWVVVIDNASTDGTADVARDALASLGLRGEVVVEPRPGKGRAVRAGLHAADADVYVMTDADNTYTLATLPALVARVRTGEADLVVGDRLANGSYDRVNKRPFHGSGNRLVGWALRARAGGARHDVLSGFRVMSAAFVQAFPLRSDGFDLEVEMSLHAIRTGARIHSAPVECRARPAGTTSKLATVRDGVRILSVIAGLR